MCNTGQGPKISDPICVKSQIHILTIFCGKTHTPSCLQISCDTKYRSVPLYRFALLQFQWFIVKIKSLLMWKTYLAELSTAQTKLQLVRQREKISYI